MSWNLRVKMVKTNKKHICFGCGRKFDKGTKMQFSVVVDGESAFNTYLCPTCTDIANAMRYGDEFGWGELHDDAIELEKKK